MLTPEQSHSIEIMFSRYLEVIQQNKSVLNSAQPKCSGEHLERLCIEALNHSQNYPYDKLSRWLGFVQGILCVYGLIDVDTERNFSRPIFHALHNEAIPTFE